MARFMIPCRVECDGTAIVEADNVEEAAVKFNAGAFEFDYAACSLANWESRGKPEVDE